MPKILTLSIPTWNRASLLKNLLSEITQKIIEFNLQDDIELLVSNNNSEDSSDEIIQSFKQKYNFITYYKNDTNIGGKSNVLKSMELAVSPYVMFFGDDDNVHVENLQPVIEILKSNNDIGVLLDTTLSKFQYPEKIRKIQADECARNFYWFMGNASCFITKTEYLKKNLSKYGYDFFNECWPQTQLMLIGLCENKNQFIYAGNFSLSKESAHAEVMVYSSFYLWRTVVYDLRISIEVIKHLIPVEVYKSALANMKKSAIQNFLNLLQCGVFIDEKDLKSKTVKHIFQNSRMFKGIEWILYFSVAIILSLPGFINKPFSNLFIFLLKGKKGLQKKNAFVKYEVEKKMKLSGSVRELEFEID